MAKFTQKEKKFVQEYLFDLNQTQAAIRAGYSTHTARQIAAEMMTKPRIKEAVDRALAERSKRTGITGLGKLLRPSDGRLLCWG